jgi:hypothetical protein
LSWPARRRCRRSSKNQLQVPLALDSVDPGEERLQAHRCGFGRAKPSTRQSARSGVGC